jgi:hypothetical protein
MSRSINANKKGSAIFATGGDQHQSLILRRAKKPLQALQAERRAHIAARPPNQAVNERGKWKLDLETIDFEIFLAGGKVAA